MRGWMWTLSLVEIVVVGGLLFVLPRIGRRGLLFGVYVGEERSDSPAARAATRRWSVGMGLTIAGCALLLLVLNAAGAPPAAFSLVVLPLVAGFAGSYLAAHRKARTLAAATSARAVAVLGGDELRASTLPWLTILLAIGAGVGAALNALAHFDSLPERIPTHLDLAGRPDRFADKSLVPLLLLPALAMFLGASLGGFALLTLAAKTSLRQKADVASARAQHQFRRAVARLLCGLALLVTALLCYESSNQLRIVRGLAGAPGWITIALVVAILGATLGSVIRLMARYGQGGARLEGDSAAAALSDGLADNRSWKLGLFYVNREDPSILLEKRFGFGYTINLGNPLALVILGGFFAILFGIVALAIAAA